MHVAIRLDFLPRRTLASFILLAHFVPERGAVERLEGVVVRTRLDGVADARVNLRHLFLLHGSIAVLRLRCVKELWKIVYADRTNGGLLSARIRALSDRFALGSGHLQC